MLNQDITEAQEEELNKALDNLAIQFCDHYMSDARRFQYFKHLATYPGFTFTFPQLLKAITLAHYRWEQAGEIPTVRFIMKTIDPG